MGALRDLYNQHGSKVSAAALVYSVMGVMANVAGVLHITGMVELELMAEVFAEGPTPGLGSFALTTAWWVSMSAGSAWAYLNSYDTPEVSP